MELDNYLEFKLSSMNREQIYEFYNFLNKNEKERNNQEKNIKLKKNPAGEVYVDTYIKNPFGKKEFEINERFSERECSNFYKEFKKQVRNEKIKIIWNNMLNNNP